MGVSGLCRRVPGLGADGLDTQLFQTAAVIRRGSQNLQGECAALPLWLKGLYAAEAPELMLRARCQYDGGAHADAQQVFGRAA